MPSPSDQRAFALETVQKLRAAGFEALWAGGCVRDMLLSIQPKDYDVATNATPESIRNLFGRRRTLAIGAAFGVITVLGPRSIGQIEVATFRTDAAYSDGRHPDSVTFTDAEHDAARRDFTINGLFYDPVADKVVDYVQGQQDLAARTIRAIGDPRLRIGEDKLRMLRAVRFAATFDFAIEPATLAAIQEMAAEITTVSAERIGMEIRRMLLDPNCARALELLRETNLLPHVLPEAASLDESAFAQVCQLLSRLQKPTLPLALATLLSTEHQVLSTQYPVPRAEVSSPLIAVPTSSPTHETSDCITHSPLPIPHSPLAPSLARRLRYTNKESDRATWLLAQLPAIATAHTLPWSSLQRILIHDGAAELIALRKALAGPEDAGAAFAEERLAWPPERLNPKPFVDGSDLIRHGLTPGPYFSVLLEQIRDAQLNGEITSRDEALALTDRLRSQ